MERLEVVEYHSKTINTVGTLTAGIFSESRQTVFFGGGAKFEIYDSETNESAAYKNRTAKSVNVLKYCKFLKVIL